MRTMWLAILTVLVMVGGTSQTTEAAEISVLSGLYKQEKSKTNGDSTGGQSETEIGARYGDDFDQGMIWFGQGRLTLRSYEAAKGGKSPSSSTSLRLGGGLRLYFDAFTQGLTPFVYGLAEYVNDNTASVNGLAYTENETSGLFYEGYAGFRFGLDSVIFLDLEANLFSSALTATTRSETVSPDGAGGTTTTKSETSRTEVYVDTRDPFSSFVVSLGVKI